MAESNITYLSAITSPDDSVAFISGTDYSISDFRDAYIDNLSSMGNGSVVYKKKINYICNIKNDCTPISEYDEINGDTEPNRDKINLIITDAISDFMIIDNEIQSMAKKYSNIIRNTKSKIDNLSSIIYGEYYRLKDLQLLKSSYENIDNITILSDKDFNGDFNYDEKSNSISAKSVPAKEPIYIIDIDGNGYEGNTFAYDTNKKAFVDEYYGKISRSSINDESLSTYYEYSRICGKTPDEQNSNINVDNINAKCTILIQTVQTIDSIKINSDNEKLGITQISTSVDDGKTYTDQLKSTNKIQNAIGLPSTKYIKIQLESDYIDTEYAVAVDHIVNGEKGIKIYDDAYRKVIRINQITAFRNTYDNNGITTVKTDNLVADNKSIKTIAIYADSYVPDSYPAANTNESYIIYTLTINGKEYIVTPINSSDKGIKIISYRDMTYASDSVSYLSEKIKSAYLTIKIKALDGYGSPQVSNIKICTGVE